MSHFLVGVIARPGQDVDELLAPYMENCCATPDYKYLEFYEDESCDIDEATGKRGYWENPNAKWDWYEVGGRWDGHFDGSNVINVKDYDTSIDLDTYNVYLGEWRAWERGDKIDPGENFELACYKPEYLKDFYKNAETYARIKATPWMRAVVTPDGEWHEVGRMGWWGCSDETSDDRIDWVDHFAERFILPYSNGMYTITAVDCHI